MSAVHSYAIFRWGLSFLCPTSGCSGQYFENLMRGQILGARLFFSHELMTTAQTQVRCRPSEGVPNPGWLSWFPVNLGQSWLLNLSGRHPTFFYSNRLAGDQAERMAKPLPFIQVIQQVAGLDWDLCKPADKPCNCVPPQTSRRTLGRLALHASRYCCPTHRYSCNPCMLWIIQGCKESGVIPHKRA